MSEFPKFSAIVASNAKKLAEKPMFKVDISYDELKEIYLSSFPPGTNEKYKERTYHDCQCCLHFIRDMGAVVGIGKDLKLHTVWDNCDKAPYPYDVVAALMAANICSRNIKGIFLPDQPKYGNKSNVQFIDNEFKTIRWDHLYCDFPLTEIKTPTNRSKLRSEARSIAGVIERSFVELSPGAVETVIDMCEENTLYRGRQNLKTLKDFQAAQKKYNKLIPERKNRFVWSKADYPALAIRNTSIGTLLTDLSNGVPEEEAVRKYEAMVAPTNYRRTSAVITKSMVERAVEKLRELELDDAIYRRHANPTDVSVNDVLFASRSTASIMRDHVLDLLLPETKSKAVSSKGLREVPIVDFITKVLPGAQKLEIQFEDRHVGNLVSITAPEHKDVKPLFSWDNNFAWSYNGNVTDSIAQRVKAAGGNIEAFCRASLAWFNIDDLDIHDSEPDGTLIYYGRKNNARNINKRYGQLDVDMNVTSPYRRDAVENIVWTQKMLKGSRLIAVNNFCKRGDGDPGFVVEVATPTETLTMSYKKDVRYDETIPVCSIKFDGSKIEVVPTSSVVVGGLTKEIWSLKTSTFHEVTMAMLSPNHWGKNSSGNTHWIFALDKCINPEPTRGFYTEFLRRELHEHRKVFETLASKTTCQPADRQLSGLGFSETKRDNFVARINGGQLYKVMI